MNTAIRYTLSLIFAICVMLAIFVASHCAHRPSAIKTDADMSRLLLRASIAAGGQR